MILTVERAFGRLREVFYENSSLRGTNPENDKFYAEKKFIKCWQDYGQYNENRIILKKGDETDSIIYNGVEFHPVIKDIHFFLKSRNDSDSHVITIEGRFKDGRIFEQDFRFKSSETLPYIVYAIIIISYSTDIDEALTTWKILNSYYPSKNVLPGEFLDVILRTRSLGNKIISDYPFMESFIQDGLKNQIDDLKHRIEDLDILK